jgi:alkanesulfonate monooxygenase SsuD/methylene tetrahydromethanopterin reductase-like flavin-dependent oxidoreductase (luciferase family)
MEFGYHHVSFAGDDDRGAALVERARFLDQSGFSWLSMMDHLWQIGGNGYHDEPFLDCYTALPAVAAVTDTMELSALVTPPHYRNPAYLARVLASLDDISGGRAVLGVGAGWFEAEYAAYGVDFPDPSTRVAEMRETIELCRTLWAETPATYRGDHYVVEDVVLEPSPDEVPVLV